MLWATKRRSHTSLESADSGISFSQLQRRKRVRGAAGVAVLVALSVGASGSVLARSKAPTILTDVPTTAATAKIEVPTTIESPMVSTAAVSITAPQAAPTDFFFAPTCAWSYSSDRSIDVYLEIDGEHSVNGSIGTVAAGATVIEQVWGKIAGSEIELVAVRPDGTERMVSWAIADGGITIEDGTFVQIGPCSGD